MTRKIRRIVDDLKGRGEILKDDTPIAEVWYDISIYQEFLIPNGSSAEIPGKKSIHSYLTVISGERSIKKEDNPVLLLDDGRKASFIPTTAPILNDTYEIVIQNPDEVFKD